MKNRYIKLFAAAFGSLIFAAAANAQSNGAKPSTQRARVEITEMGYTPDNIRLRKGVPARLTFVRRTDRTCGTEIVIPDYGINKPLPLGQAVVVSFTPKRAGTLGFTCGMNMMRGKLIVR